MDGVQHVSQRPLDFGLSGIKIDPYLLCCDDRRWQQYQGEQGEKTNVETSTCMIWKPERQMVLL